MTNALKLAALLLAGMAACAVVPDDQSETSATSTLASELSTTGSESASATGALTSLTCTSVWECDPVCGTWINGVLYRYSTNVLHRECDDGSDTVIRQDPCGEACF